MNQMCPFVYTDNSIAVSEISFRNSIANNRIEMSILLLAECFPQQNFLKNDLNDNHLDSVLE